MHAPLGELILHVKIHPPWIRRGHYLYTEQNSPDKKGLEKIQVNLSHPIVAGKSQVSAQKGIIK